MGFWNKERYPDPVIYIDGTGWVRRVPAQNGSGWATTLPIGPVLHSGEDPKGSSGSAKAPLWLVPGSASVHIAEALADGVKKYGPFNWRKTNVLASVYLSAALRHIHAYIDGENYSRDAKVHHIAHAMAGLAILMDAMEAGTLVDDRPVKGPAADVQQRYFKKKEPTVSG